MITLSAAIGRYAHTAPLLDGAVTSPALRLDFAAVAPISRAFAPMVREGRYDVSEMAIATFLQARAWGKPLVLLPVVLAARFQEAALLCRADGPIRGPADLAGRRVDIVVGRVQDVRVTHVDRDADLVQPLDKPLPASAGPACSPTSRSGAGRRSATHPSA